MIVVLLSTKQDLSKKVFDKVQGVEYNEIFSLVAMLKSVRIMLQLPHFMKSGKWMSNLNGFLKEELYMIQQEGFVNPKGANKVCKLQRSIYNWCKPLGVGINVLIV